MPKGRKKHQQKVWDERYKRIKEACWEIGRTHSYRDLAKRTGYSKSAIQKYVKEIEKDRPFMDQLSLKTQIDMVRSRFGLNGLEEKLIILYEGSGGWVFQRRDQSMPIIPLGEKKLHEGSRSENLRELLNHLVSDLVELELQFAYLGNRLEDPINREKAELFMQYDESEMSDGEYENVLRSLIPPGRVYIVYAFNTERLIETLKSLHEDRNERVLEEEDLKDLERYLQRKEHESG